MKDFCMGRSWTANLLAVAAKQLGQIAVPA